MERIWGEIKPSLRLIADRPKDDPQAAEAFALAETKLPLLTQASNHLVVTFEAERHRMHRNVIWIISAVALFDIALLLASFWIARKYASSQKQAEQAENLFRAIFDSSAIGIALVDREGRPVQCNAALREMLDFSDEELCGMTFSEFTHPEDIDKDLALYEELKNDERSSYQMAKRYIRKGGQVVWGHLTASLLRGNDRESQLAIGMVQDITETRRSEEELAKFKLGIERSSEAIFITDTEGTITYANPAFEKIYGFTPEETLGNTPRILKSGLLPPEAYKQFWDTLLAREVVSGELLNKARNGRILTVYGSANPILDEKENIIGFLAIQRDITEHKRDEQELKESQERLNSLIDALPEGVCLLDENRRLILANPAARQYLQILTEAETGEAISQVGEDSLEEILHSCKDGAHYQLTLAGAEPRIFEISAHSISQEEQDRGWVLVLWEVTQERQLQERMQQQDRLAAVGQLAAGIAHDFNNLLTVIMGVAQMMDMNEDIPDALREDIQSIFAQGQRAAQLVRQILDFSRKSIVQRQPLDLVPFLHEMVTLLQRTLPENIRIECAFPEEKQFIKANSSQLQEIVTNLAVNARDAMPIGGEFRIELSPLHLAPDHPAPVLGMKPGDWVVMSATDTGTGMPADVLKRIYEPFFTTKPSGEGTGLGLSQVYGIVKQNEGEIAVESAPGEGTTFRLFLPLYRGELENEPPIADFPRGAGETILIVEDEDQVLKVAIKMLEWLNYRVLPATNGQEALELYRRGRGEIDLVLSDIMMPEIGGIELLGRLREIDPQVRVVFMSGYAQGLDEKNLYREISGRLKKPLILEQVAQTLSGIFRQENG